MSAGLGLRDTSSGVDRKHDLTFGGVEGDRDFRGKGFRMVKEGKSGGIGRNACIGEYCNAKLYCSTLIVLIGWTRTGVGEKALSCSWWLVECFFFPVLLGVGGWRRAERY